MAGVGHLYITMHGSFTGTWTGETAQCGLRLLVRPAGLNDGPVVPVHDNGSVQQIYNDYSLTQWDVTQTFDMQWGGVPASTSEMCDDIAADVRAFWIAVQGQYSNNFRWTHLKIAPIERGTGKYLAPSSTYTAKTPLVGSGTPPMPPEVSTALSMRAGIVGKRGRGRIYWPAPSTGMLDGSGKVAAASRTTLANSFVTLIENLNNVPGVEPFRTQVAVMSAANVTAVLPAEVRVGDHFDVQRRRQHQVDETYTVASLS